MTKTIIRKRRMKESLSSSPFNQSMTNLCSLFQHQPSNLFKFGLLTLVLISIVASSGAASVTGSRGRRNSNIRYHVEEFPPQLNQPNTNSRRSISDIHHYRLLDNQNEYDSSGSILDDDTLRLSLAIDDDSSTGGGLSAPSLHTLEPRVYLRISGESGMIRPDYQVDDEDDDDERRDNRNNEVIKGEHSFNSFRASSPISNSKRGEVRRPDLHFQSEDDGEVEDAASEDEDMSDNYHHHYPYIESYREKYTRPEPRHFLVTTTPPPSPSQALSIPSSLRKDESSQKQEWSDIIAQATTPSSFNEINSSASEHRLADFHFRANLPSYFYNKYSSYSEEDLENVADLDDEHSKYFVKTRPRSVATAGSNIYSNFYYEPPSFSTKSVPIPVKTNKEKFVFVSAKPSQYHHQLHPHPHSALFEEGDGRPIQHHHDQDHFDDDGELSQHDSPVMTTIPTNFSSNVPSVTPPQMSYDREEGEVYHDHRYPQHHQFPNSEPILKTSASAVIPPKKDYHKTYQNLNNASNNHSNKSSAETLDVSTSQSILSKVTVNNPHTLQYNRHLLNQPHPQIVHIGPAEYHAKTGGATPEYRRSDDDGHDHGMTSGVKIASSDGGHHSFIMDADTSSPSTTTEHPPTTVADGDASSTGTTTPASTVTTTTDPSSIPGVPGVDYPTLENIPQTGFDCQKQRYKGFFADIDAKCQAWHYCDFTDGHSTFLCPNGTLFSQVLLTCDWWFNVDCKQARQLYVLNERLYRYIKPPKPSFPEDFIGEHVDKWLLQQFNNGYLPKVRRKKAKPKFVVSALPPLPSSPTDAHDHDPPPQSSSSGEERNDN